MICKEKIGKKPPVRSAWVFRNEFSSASACASGCANGCGYNVQHDSGFRGGVFGSAGNSRTTIYYYWIASQARNDKECSVRLGVQPRRWVQISVRLYVELCGPLRWPRSGHFVFPRGRFRVGRQSSDDNYSQRLLCNKRIINNAPVQHRKKETYRTSDTEQMPNRMTEL